MNNWFYQSGEAKVGPVSFQELQRLAAAGTLARTTLVWTEGMPTWKPAVEVTGIFGDPPPLPPGGPPPGYSSPPPPAYVPHINNHLTYAILVTIFCCLPLGIVAIVKAAQVNGRAEAGDYEGAQRLSNEANNWANWSLGVGVVWILVYLVGMLASS